MNDSEHRVATKEKKFKVKSKDKKKEFEVEITDKEAKFKENKKDQIAKVNAKIIIREVKDGKVDDTSKNEKTGEVEVSYDKGTFWDNLELKKVDSVEIDGKKKFGGSYKWPFWAVIVTAIIIVVGGIAWWIMASRKEDKEEGDL